MTESAQRAAADAVDAIRSSERWPNGPERQQMLVTMDGGTSMKATVQRPDRYGAFYRSLEGAAVAPRGAGLSFAAASFGHAVTSVELGAFDRILGLDHASQSVEVEAGVTLGALFQYLFAHGLYLPIQPGYTKITVGGCIGADVHGKNPARDGTFVSQVVSLVLFHPDHGTMELSATQERELFHATCGGFGLTGVILTARIRVSRLPSRRAELTIVPISTVIEGAAILRSASDEPGGVHAWHDFSRRGDGFGRGHVRILRFASDAAEDAPPPAMPPSRLSADRRGVLPMRLLNRWTLRAINEFYAFSHRSGRQPIDVLRALFPIHGSEAYFYLFGRAGFHETQVIVPHGQLQAYLELVRSMAERFQVLITLGATKFFDGRSELLRFDGEGISVAINIPRDRNAARFLAELDRFVIEAGARPSLIKDSRLSRQVFDATYPESDRFRSLLRAWDPKRRFRSELSDRLGL